jgi:putative molybdopterin biosynthesis protein
MVFVGNMSRSAHIGLRCVWTFGPVAGRPEEAMLFELLAGIARAGSVATAARSAGVSYRNAWGLLRRWAERFGQPLAQMQRGRGSSLTRLGEELLKLDQETQKRLAPTLEAAARRMAQLLEKVGERNQARVAIHASHDLGLVRLRDLLTDTKRIHLDLKFHGSLDSLASLSRSECELAGFHVPSRPDPASRSAFHQWLKPATMKLIRFVIREQGLIVEPGNPRKIRTLKGLTKPGVRFINRQDGSGTRLQFDQLLAQAGIDKAAISGYGSEEFTHLAVAATIAGGMANAGFGIRAAAVQYGLDFIPLATERYFLACRAEILNSSGLRAFVEVLRGPEFKKLVADLPGYDAAHAGEIAEVGEALLKA